MSTAATLAATLAAVAGCGHGSAGRRPADRTRPLRQRVHRRSLRLRRHPGPRHRARSTSTCWATCAGRARSRSTVENVNGTVITTNLATGGTFTRKFANSGRDHTIVDNGDGTITITMHAQGIVRYYDQFGRFVLKDPGSLWTSFGLDHGGTPGRPLRRRRGRGLIPGRTSSHRQL